MQRRLDFELTVRGPFLTASSEPGAYGLDAVAWREADGAFGLPKTLLVGKLREASKFLTSLGWTVPADFERRLGGLEDTGGHWDPRRRGAYLTPVRMDPPVTPGPRITRIAMDRKRRAASDRMMLVLENPVPVGDSATLRGAFEFWETDVARFDEFHAALGETLRTVTQLGAERTTGFGSVTGVALERAPEVPVRLEFKGTPKLEEGVWLAIRPLEPFTITARNVVSNLFEAAEVIPGAAIKGAIATMIAERGAGTLPALEGALSDLRITHAFPAADPAARPTAVPLSLAWTGSGFHDMAAFASPVLVGGKAPAFDVDWKDATRRKALDVFGWKDTSCRLVERHAHDGVSRTAADEKVFAIEQRLPGDAVWLARLSLPAAGNAQAPDVSRELGLLLHHGLYHLGKGHALAGVQFVEDLMARPAKASTLEPVHGHWIVVLMSDAVLADPAKLGLTTGASELLVAYREAWTDLSGHTLELSHFFARQKLAGGEYLRNRFGTGAGSYHPYVLTDAGSVFVFKAASDEAVLGRERAAIEDFLSRGLRLPTWARNRYKESWKTCPYLRENGYGEIAVNIEHGLYLAPAAPRPSGGAA